MTIRDSVVGALLADYEGKVVSHVVGLVVSAIPESIAETVLDAIPDGWAKVNGQWVLLALYGPVDIGDGQADAYVRAEALVRAPEVTPRIKQRADDDDPIHGLPLKRVW